MELAKADAAALEPDEGTTDEAPPAKEAKPRAADGKFAKTDDKSEEAPAAKAKTKPEAGKDERVPDGIAHARRVFNEGKIDEFFKLTLGVDVAPEGLTAPQWASVRKEQQKAIAKVKASEQAAQAEWQKVNQAATQLQQMYRPLAEAAKLRDEGDWAAAARAFFGVEPPEVTKKILRAEAARDPKVERLEAELRQFRAQQAKDQEQREQMAAQTQRQQKQAEYKAAIAADVAELSDARMVRVAKKPAFIEKVFEIESNHYNGQEVTISREEAAELAFDELYGDVLDSDAGADSSAVRDRGAKTTRLPARAATPVRQAAKATTTLRQSEAAEAAPEDDDMTPDQIYDFYVKKATAEARRTG